jgi:hypothetical protein
MKRATTLSIGTVPVVAVAATVISSSRAIAPRADELTYSEDYGLGQIDISAAVAAASPAGPLCSPSCWDPATWSENFDNVTPPALPRDRVVTNAQGAPPLRFTFIHKFNTTT